MTNDGARGRVRTYDPQLRKLMLYPAELHAHVRKTVKRLSVVSAAPVLVQRTFVSTSHFGPRASLHKDRLYSLPGDALAVSQHENSTIYTRDGGCLSNFRLRAQDFRKHTAGAPGGRHWGSYHPNELKA